MSIELSADGPHCGEYTLAVAGVFAESVRVLNHATMPGAGGLQYPSEVYTMLGDLAVGVERLPQLLAQLVAFLRHAADAGRLGEDPGAEYGGDPVMAAFSLETAAHTAARAARWLAEDLRTAQSDTRGLHAIDAVAPRSCVLCGCTDAAGCPAGCSWTDAGADLGDEVCSECVDQYAYQVDVWIVGDGNDEDEPDSPQAPSDLGPALLPSLGELS